MWVASLYGLFMPNVMFCCKVLFHFMYSAKHDLTKRALCFPFLHIVVKVKRNTIPKSPPTLLALMNVGNNSSG